MNDTRSPIVSLERALAGAPYRIAPERESELFEWINQNAVTFTIEEGSGFQFAVEPQTGAVSTTVATLEYLWASAHAYIVLYNEYCLAQARGDLQFGIGQSQRASAAVDLLTWSMRNVTGNGQARWPDDLPRPAEDPIRGSDVHIANEVYLCSVAWIIHHELSHVRLCHAPTYMAGSIEDERAADLAATNFILREAIVEDERRKRTLGIAAAILALQGLDGFKRRLQLYTHPEAFKRIDYCLAESGISEDDEIYAFCVVVMQFQLAFKGQAVAHDGTSYRDLFCEYLIEFARARDV